MTLNRPLGLRVTVAIAEPDVARKVVAALEALGVSHRVVAGDRFGDPVQEAGVVHCLSAAAAAELRARPTPAVLVGSTRRADTAEETDETVGTALLPVGDLTPAGLLRALVVATLDTNADFIARDLAQLRMFSAVRSDLVRSFLRDPGRMRRLSDLRRSRGLSRARAQMLVRSTKRFERAEHLFTALRCASWAVLTDLGFSHSIVEQYFGIKDRTAFRRACHRAGVHAPRDGMMLTAFSH